MPRDCYFVLGDNRDQSEDSRYWGFVPRQNITGRPLLIYFSRVEAEDDAGDDDAPVASTPPDVKLFTLRARISHVLGACAGGGFCAWLPEAGPDEDWTSWR